MEKSNISAGSRLGSMFLDHVIMCFLSMIIVAPVFFIGFDKSFYEEANGFTNNISLTLFFAILAISLYFNKDAFQGKSLAKRVFNQEVINIKTNEIASPLKCLLRNITIILWPIEVIAVMISPSRRLGDLIAGTRIAPISQQPVSNATINLKDILIAIVISYAILFLGSFLIKDKVYDGAFDNSKFDKSTYNQGLSTQIENAVNDSNKLYLQDSQIKVYDRIENDTVKYVSGTFYLNENYIANDSQFEEVKERVFNTMFKVIPKTEFILFGKFIYDGPETKITTSRQYDWRKIK